MTKMYAAHLNEAGVAHVAAELKRLGLEWDLSATCSAIEGTPGFMDLTTDPNDYYEYEIANKDVGKRGYGVVGYIEVWSRHAQFEPVDE
ncbi:hypothetical protein [Roseibium sp. RKSG952]|uniref:hypothetical protein n=1 Tax=Roseibium sp. RKSG952 TaxID=2529384 RepID=UPI0012BCE29E|nr:hypothetical protein [Roseibium sp. RKSG952]MTH94985.1 hypothetical protein [Roseibium sp. RKSG952]